MSDKRLTYISGPISASIPGTTVQERKGRFYACESWIRLHRPCWEPVNPLRVEAACGSTCGGAGVTLLDDHSWQCWMRYDLKALLDCHHIVLLPGWDMSPGASVELSIAKWVGMRVFMANRAGEVYA